MILPTQRVAVLPDSLSRCCKSIFLREHLPSIQQGLRRLPCRTPGVSKLLQPLWQPLHFHRRDSFFFPKLMGVWHFQSDYTNFWIIRFITTFQLSKLPVWKGLYSSTSVQEVWITIRSFRVYPKGFGQTCVFREKPFLRQVVYLFVSHFLNGLPLLLVSHCLID